MMSSANNLRSLIRYFGKSLGHVKNKRGPGTEPHGNPAPISTQDKQ